MFIQGDLTSVQAVEAIVSAKQKEHLEELERKKLEVAAQHDRELQQAAEEHRALHEDNQLRKARVETMHACIAVYGIFRRVRSKAGGLKT